MKTAPNWKVLMQKELGNFLRGDPVFTNGKTLLQTFAERIQKDALEDAMEYVAHSKACPIARGIEYTACECGLNDVQRQWRELNTESSDLREQPKP